MLNASFVSFNALSTDLKRGIKAEFLIDTGAQVSVINYPSFKAISNVQSLTLIPTKSNVRAADRLIIPFKGQCTIKFSLDIQGKYIFEHNFWVAAE